MDLLNFDASHLTRSQKISICFQIYKEADQIGCGTIFIAETTDDNFELNGHTVPYRGYKLTGCKCDLICRKRSARGIMLKFLYPLKRLPGEQNGKRYTEKRTNRRIFRHLDFVECVRIKYEESWKGKSPTKLIELDVLDHIMNITARVSMLDVEMAVRSKIMKLKKSCNPHAIETSYWNFIDILVFEFITRHPELRKKYFGTSLIGEPLLEYEDLKPILYARDDNLFDALLQVKHKQFINLDQMLADMAHVY